MKKSLLAITILTIASVLLGEEEMHIEFGKAISVIENNPNAKIIQREDPRPNISIITIQNLIQTPEANPEEITKIELLYNSKTKEWIRLDIYIPGYYADMETGIGAGGEARREFAVHTFPDQLNWIEQYEGPEEIERFNKLIKKIWELYKKQRKAEMRARGAKPAEQDIKKRIEYLIEQEQGKKSKEKLKLKMPSKPDIKIPAFARKYLIQK